MLATQRFTQELSQGIRSHDKAELRYAKALLAQAQQGIHYNHLGTVLSDIEYLADECIEPTDDCLVVMDKAFAACDPLHNEWIPTILYLDGVDEPFVGLVRHHACIPYGRPVGLRRHEALRVMKALRGQEIDAVIDTSGVIEDADGFHLASDSIPWDWTLFRSPCFGGNEDPF